MAETLTPPSAASSTPVVNDARPAFAVLNELRDRFGDTLQFQPTREDFPTVWVSREQLTDVLMFLRTLPRPYVMLYDLSAVDERLRQHREGLPASDFTVFYHLMSIERNSDIRIKVALKEGDLNCPTATRIWPNANWYEREAFDLFGIVFDGHNDLRRILTDYGFIGHPFRKDFPLSGHVEMRYDADQRRVVYEPVSIEPREITPRIIREDKYGGLH